MSITNSAKSGTEFSIKITPAINESIESIKKIENECGLSPWSFEDYILELARKDSIFLTARNNNNIVGFLLARLIMTGNDKIIKNENDTAAESYSEIEIYNIAVKNEFRRQGIGQHLLNYFFKRIKSLGASKVWLEVRESNCSAIAFYYKNGFENIYKRKNFYTAPVENAIVMSLDLAV